MNSNNRIVLVASVSILKDGKILMIQEKKQKAYQKWTFPAGRIEYGEDILQAACREAKEETGFDVTLMATTGIFNFVSSSNQQVMMFHFIGEVAGGSLTLNEEEILDAKWMTVSDIKNVESNELRDYNVFMQILNLLEKKEYYSLNIFKKQLLI